MSKHSDKGASSTGRRPAASPTSPRPAATTKDPQAIARRVVDLQLEPFTGDLEAFLHPGDFIAADVAAELFDELLGVVSSEEIASNPSYYQGLDVEDLPYNHQLIGARAGFLVGLELGRRLGGAR